jgi:hypothetical protein
MALSLHHAIPAFQECCEQRLQPAQHFNGRCRSLQEVKMAASRHVQHPLRYFEGGNILCQLKSTSADVNVSLADGLKDHDLPAVPGMPRVVHFP